jgi:hypothetical protein
MSRRLPSSRLLFNTSGHVRQPGMCLAVSMLNGWAMQEITEHGLLEVLADFDGHGGASLGLVAWELCATDQQVKGA